MKIDGTVTTGLGKAAYFLSQDFYVNNFKKNCGFRPYPGTLNVIVPEEYLPQINKVKNECKNIIKPDEGFGAVKYIKARRQITHLQQNTSHTCPCLCHRDHK